MVLIYLVRDIPSRYSLEPSSKGENQMEKFMENEMETLISHYVPLKGYIKIPNSDPRLVPQNLCLFSTWYSTACCVKALVSYSSLYAGGMQIHDRRHNLCT